MQQAKNTKISLPRPKMSSFLLVTVAAVILIIVLIQRPSRSIPSYCKEYETENARLDKLPGSTYQSKVFAHGSSDPNDFVAAFTKLDAVAPFEIEPDIAILKKTYQSIKSDPTSELKASIGGLAAESNVASWSSKHCPK